MVHVCRREGLLEGLSAAGLPLQDQLGVPSVGLRGAVDAQVVSPAVQDDPGLSGAVPKPSGSVAS